MKTIKLGYIVKDVITGFTGIAIQKIEQFNGNVQYAIQPQSDSTSTYVDAMCIDHHTVDVISDGIVDRAATPKSVTIELGSKVRDRASGFEGIATQRTTYFNGCISYAVIPKIRDNALLNDIPAENWISQDRLEKIDDGLIETVKSASGKTGGPSQRIKSPCAPR